MRHVFPLVTETSKIRGIISIIRQNGGSMELSSLAEEADEQIDDLMPLVEASKLLGFATVDESMIKVTPLGESLNISNSSKLIREKLVEMDPFYSAIEILGKKSLSTDDLLDALSKRGVSLHGNREANDILMKKMLMRLGVRTKIVYYDPEKDVWSSKPFKK